MERNIINLLKNSVEKYPQFNYLNDKIDGKWQATSFLQTDKNSSALALSLLELGLQEEDKAAIISESRGEWVIAELAIIKIKGISVPLSVKLLEEELIIRLNHSKSKFIFTSENHIEKVLKIYDKLDVKPKIIYFENETDKILNLIKKYQIPSENFFYYQNLIEKNENSDFKAVENLSQKIKEDDVLTISYTSGTTGDPKGIMLTHKNYWHNVHQALKHFNNDIPQFSKSLIILPIDHSFAHTAGIYAAMLLPYSLYFLDAKGGTINAIKNIPINLKEVQPDFLFTVPALTSNFMNKILENIRKQNFLIQKIFNLGLKAGKIITGDGYNKTNFAKRLFFKPIHKFVDFLIFKKVRKNFGNYKFSIGGGALLDISQQYFFAAVGMPIYQGYGLTEATPIISANTPSVHKFGSSGKPFPMMEIKIIDDDGNELPIGKKGQIIIKGDNVMKGYYKNPTATQKTIKDGWLYTSDIGYIDEDGFLIVTGREKALLISLDGEKYSPEEIEETIMSNSPFILQIMLYNDHSKFTSAIITLDENYLNFYIKKHKNITAEKLLEEIEKSIFNFKKDKALKNKFPSRWLPSAFYIAPENFTEKNKMLNSTLKIVRFRIIETYKKQIEMIYEDSEKIKKLNLETLKKYLKSIEN